jgi:two-component system nitrogen regulation sensor histidine kinase NtrY
MRRSLLENNQKKPRNRGFTIVGLVILVAIYIAALIVVQQSRLAFGAVSLQAITALNITLILVMLFVLGRNIIKLYVERRRKKLGSQFSMRVVVTYIGMALVPTVLLFIVASGLIRTAVESWFSTDTEQIVRRAREVSEQSLEGQARELQRVADMISDEIRRGNIGTADSNSREFLREWLLIPRSRQAELEAILVYEGSELLLDPYFDPDGEYATFFQRPTISPVPSAAPEQTNGEPTWANQPLPETHPLYVPPAQISMALQQQSFRLIDGITEGVRLLRAGVPIYHPSRRNEVTGVLVVARVIADELVTEVAEIEGLYDSFMSGLAEKEPILSNYQLTFLLMTLLIIFSALWVGLYLARGVTVPIQKLAEGTRAVASGDLSYQVEVEAQDELGTLVESFNQMTSDLRAGQKNLRQSRDSLQAKNT